MPKEKGEKQRMKRRRQHYEILTPTPTKFLLPDRETLHDPPLFLTSLSRSDLYRPPRSLEHIYTHFLRWIHRCLGIGSCLSHADRAMHLFCCFSSPSMKTRASGSTASPAGENGKGALARDLRINCVAGDGVCGILYKWVNYWTGWRLRWFVLEDGVLSYYKFHGPDKIVVNKEMVKGARLIGDDSIKWIHRQQLNHHSSSSPQERPKAAGEIHLKVSFIQESRSDDRQFGIFTGMKWLHLKAESRESRNAWMEAIQAVKEVLPLIPRNELMAREWSLSTSTEKLKQRLLEEGLNEAAIREVEQIMKNEFGSLQNQLLLLNQRQWVIKEMLRQLEVHAKLSIKPLNSYRSAPPMNCAH